MRQEDVYAALDRLGVRGPRARCPVCEANAWGGIEGATGTLGAHVQAIDPDGEITPGAGIECAVMICNTCGYVRLHALDALGKA